MSGPSGSQFAQIERRLRAVIAIPVTPFTRDGEVDGEAYVRVITRLVDGGISAVTPNGNTSEFYALSPRECRTLVASTVDLAGSRALVMPGVGFDISTAIAMARHAQQAGAPAVMVHQPVHPYKSAAGWVAYHRAFADAVADLGIVLYIRDVSVTPDMVLQLVEGSSNVVGIKYAVPNPAQFGTFVQEIGGDRVVWLCGLAELWAPFFWIAGAKGFTSGLANIDARQSLEMLRSLEAGDYAAAMAVWARIKPFEDLRARHNNANNVPVVKEALSLLGLCERTVRPPISELAQSEREEGRAILATWAASGALAD
jgi:4-hydroxy-tetrahydrodipicolinate synthase